MFGELDDADDANEDRPYNGNCRSGNKPHSVKQEKEGK